MKNIKYTFVFILCFFSLSSCFKDQGNYDYMDVNEIAIDSLGGPYNLYFKVDTLRIKPHLTFTMDTNDPNRYAYEWRIGQATEGNKRPLVSTDRDLELPIDLTPDTYSVYYTVHDKETDLKWSSYTTLTVSTPNTRGFFVSGEDEDGYAEVDMIAFLVSDTVIMKNLLKDNGMPRYKKPLRAFHTGTTSDPKRAKMWIMNGEGSYYVNTKTFEASPGNTFKNLLFTSFEMPLDIYPVELAPRVFAAGGNQNFARRLVITNTGHIFSADLFNGDFYANPINRVGSASTNLFEVEPFFFYSPKAYSLARYVVYDKVGKRFLRAVPTDPALTAMSDAQTDIFPWIQGATGRDFVYGENTNNTELSAPYGNSYAIMKDLNNQYNIYMFYVGDGSIFSPSKRGNYRVQSSAVDFDKASNYTFASNRPLLFYSVGSKLYAYDFNPGLEKNYLVKDFGEEITMICTDIQNGIGHNLFVATYDNVKKGTIKKYAIGADRNTLVMTEDANVNWTGLVKVKSIDYKNSTH
ncbi:MAG: PKD-like family lipoprotein [Sphingobacterium composti]